MANGTSISVQTVRMMYEPSIVGQETGISRSNMDQRFNKMAQNGERVIAGGNGTYVTTTPARFILEVKVEGKIHRIWTESIFRNLFGVMRLSPQLRDKIESAMPSQVEIIERESKSGTKYFELSYGSANAWKESVRAST
jgi:hypothetical protein